MRALRLQSLEVPASRGCHGYRYARGLGQDRLMTNHRTLWRMSAFGSRGEDASGAAQAHKTLTSTERWCSLQLRQM